MLLSNYPVPNEGIQHKQENTTAFIDGNDTGVGTLYIAESHVTWLSGAGAGFCLEYPKICLHAISRDTSSFPQECLYLQVEGKLIDGKVVSYMYRKREEDQQSNSSSEGEQQDDETPMTEVRFVPEDKNSLDPMFAALSHCQTLHPDPEDDNSDEEYGQDFYTGEEGEGELSEQGQVTLERLENMLQAGQGDAPAVIEANGQRHEGEDMEHGDEGQFDDADMEH